MSEKSRLVASVQGYLLKKHIVVHESAFNGLKSRELAELHEYIAGHPKTRGKQPELKSLSRGAGDIKRDLGYYSGFDWWNPPNVPYHLIDAIARYAQAVSGR